MKIGRVSRFACGALVALIALGAHAQGGGAAPSTPIASTASGASAKRAADKLLRKAVQRALARTKGLAASGIAVRARDGAVVLGGWVPEQSQVQLALRTAQGMPGVTSVSNQLLVRPVGQ
ncbi:MULTISPECIES: BON domain-containing protein [Paraburkholderia]|uniref:BON domain-containing protein n=1 Tax=Paraburkholderia TaxID=1822464 RepID=UPI001D13247D|nr:MULTISPECIES: BON domain-containing protein [Paraburkholderia]